MKKIARICAAFALAMTMLFSTAFAAADGGVDWTENKVTAIGTGVAPSNALNAAQARMLARRAAIVDGYRNLAETVKGVNIDGTTTIEMNMVASDTVTSKVTAFIQGARIVSERATADGGYEVTLEVPMFGVSNSLASAVLQKPATKEAFPVVSGSAVTGTAASDPTAYASATVQREGNYTGLIVDCRGLGLQAVMSPVIKNASLQPIYGYKNLDYDVVVAKGMAGYATDMSKASRAGARPLVVKAVRLDGHNANPVLSNADADKVLVENAATHFLDQTNVVFLR